MTYTFEELSTKTVAQLRDIAKEVEHDALRGYSTMHKEDLLKALCDALGIESHIHHEVVGIDKTQVKARIRQLKAQRDAAEAAHNRSELRAVRRRIHHLKRKLRAATV
jgi:hypothetical protein